MFVLVVPLSYVRGDLLIEGVAIWPDGWIWVVWRMGHSGPDLSSFGCPEMANWWLMVLMVVTLLRSFPNIDISGVITCYYYL